MTDFSIIDNNLYILAKFGMNTIPLETPILVLTPHHQKYQYGGHTDL